MHFYLDLPARKILMIANYAAHLQATQFNAQGIGLQKSCIQAISKEYLLKDRSFLIHGPK
jgi:hypothetical protein